jgi:deoxycytidylate deaminase
MILSQISKSQQKKFKIAEAASLHADHSVHKLGAAIFKRNDLISIGFNSYKTNPRFNNINNPFKDGTYVLHAEMSAIIHARQSIEGMDCFIFRAYKNGNMAMSRPCQYCMIALIESGIRYIYYVSNEGYHRERLN